MGVHTKKRWHSKPGISGPPAFLQGRWRSVKYGALTVHCFFVLALV